MTDGVFRMTHVELMVHIELMTYVEFSLIFNTQFNMFGFGIMPLIIITILIFIYIFMEKTSTKDKILILKNFYLYVVSFVALMMIVVSLYSLIDTGLRTWVFTEADNNYYEKPMMDKVVYDQEGEKRSMTEEEIQSEEERMQKQEEQNRVARLQRDLTRNIAMLIVAFPLFSYHWYLVRKKERE